MLVILTVAAVTGLIGWFVGHEMGIASTEAQGNVPVTSTATGTTVAQPVSEQVAAGGHDFVQFACAQCHGEQGQGGVSPDVPALTGAGKELTVAQLEHIINHGLGDRQNPTSRTCRSGARSFPTDRSSDLVAYIRAGLPAVAGAEPPLVPTDQGEPVAGRRSTASTAASTAMARTGSGASRTRSRPTRRFRPSSGADFFSEFDTDAKIKEIIRTGSVLGSAPIVSMPHWGGILSDDQLNALVAYIKTLKTD